MMNYGTPDYSKLLKSDQIVVEGFRQIALDLPTKERFHYVDAACEAMTRKEDQAALVNKLYKQVSSQVDQIDFAKIPDSKGDITKYLQYRQMQSTLELLSSFDGADMVDSITTANSIHNILLNNREAFVYGYKKGIPFIKDAYCTLVMLLYSLIDMGISDYVRSISNEINNNTNKASRNYTMRDSILLHNAKALVKFFNEDKFSVIYKAFKKANANATSENLAANEALTPVLLVNEIIGGVVAAGAIPVVLANASAGGFLLAILSFLLIIRPIVYILAKGLTKISQGARNQAEFLRVAMEADRTSSDDAIAKQKKMMNNLLGLADMIEYRILKCEREATKELAVVNRSELNTQELALAKGSDFVF